MSIQLHKVPNGSKVQVRSESKCPPDHRDFIPGEIITFHHIDGMFSKCTDSSGKTVHLVAWAEVDIVL